MCIAAHVITGESPQSALVVGRIQPRPRASIARWSLKEGGGYLWSDEQKSHHATIKTKYRMLRTLKLEYWKALELAMSRKKYWRMSIILRTVLTNKIIAKLGYTSMCKMKKCSIKSDNGEKMVE